MLGQQMPPSTMPNNPEVIKNLGLRLQDLQNNTPQLVTEQPNNAAAAQHNLQQWLNDLSPYNRFIG